MQHGPYRWLRHPMYTAVLLGAAACAAALGHAAAWGVGLALLAVLVAKARLEERWLLVQRAGYAAYRTRTARFLPGCGDGACRARGDGSAPALPCRRLAVLAHVAQEVAHVEDAHADHEGQAGHSNKADIGGEEILSTLGLRRFDVAGVEPAIPTGAFAARQGPAPRRGRTRATVAARRARRQSGFKVGGQLSASAFSPALQSRPTTSMQLSGDQVST